MISSHYKLRRHLGEDHDDPGLELAYCKGCGKQTHPTMIRRPAEVHEIQGGIVTAWVSDCCGDELTPDPPVERHCVTCRHFDGEEDCNYPNAEVIQDDLDEPCQQYEKA